MKKVIFTNSMRHLLRNKLYTLLNILGLSIGISACWVIYRFVSYELSFENKIENGEHTYRLISRFGEDGEFNFSGGISSPIYFYMKEELMGIKRVVPVFKRFTKSVQIPIGEKNDRKRENFDLNDQNIISTEGNYFDMVSYEWLAGDKKHALDNPSNVVLTDSRAKYYFPNTPFEKILGRTLVYDDSVQVSVTGVVRALDFPTEFKGEEFLLLDKSKYDLSLGNWTNTNSSDMVYFQTSKEQVEIWKNKTPDNFKFFPKIPQSISHFGRLLNYEEKVRAFVDATVLFDDRLGMAFLQLMDNFKPKDFHRVENFLKDFPKGYPLAVEVRNEEWFKPEIAEQFFRLLEKTNKTNVLVDTAGRRDMLHMRLTTPTAFIRYVVANHPTDYSRLDDWVKKIEEWKEAGLQQLYFFVHQNVEVESPLLAAHFIQGLNKAIGTDLHIPNKPDQGPTLF